MFLFKNQPPTKQELTDLSRTSKPKCSLKVADILKFLADIRDDRCSGWFMR